MRWSPDHEDHGLAVAALRRGDRWIDDEVLAHIWPTDHGNVHVYGTLPVDIDGELAKLDAEGYPQVRAVPAAATTRARRRSTLVTGCRGWR